MSDWSEVDVALKNLMTAVSGLTALTAEQIHLDTPWDPEELLADGRRHLAVWPASEGAEEPEPLALGSHQLNQLYVVLVWEDTGEESSRGRRDEASARAFLDLHNACRARLYLTSSQQLAGSDRVWYAGSAFPDRTARTRWFAISVAVRRFIAFTG